MGKLFGTDGIRGQSNVYPLTAEIALKVGMAVAHYVRQNRLKTNSVVIGKDTRLSGYMFEQALTAGFVAMGMNVFLVGVKPTPAIAMMTRALRADVSVVISASHNLYEDNGIKIFDNDGYKLDTPEEEQIEDLVINHNLQDYLVAPAKIGKVKRIRGSSGRYMEFLKATLPKNFTLDGIKIVLDCANGAGYKLTPNLLYELGANDLTTIGNTPNGFNINSDCGSTHVEGLAQKVLAEKADIGIALDGDADRVIIIDELGNVIDGDQLMALFSVNLAKEGLLNKNTTVSTVMSNMGLEVFLKEHNINLVRTAVGDRHVIDYMWNHKLNFGGEQSGHIILRDHNTTGDGILAALHVLKLMKQKQEKASTLLHQFTPYPQVLRNIRITEKMRTLEDKIVQQTIHDAEQTLGTTGRILVRKSGTEPLIRVMVEALDKKMIDTIVNTIVQTIETTAT